MTERELIERVVAEQLAQMLRVASFPQDAECFDAKRQQISAAALSVMTRATAVFGNFEKASRWLNTPHPRLGGMSPADVLLNSESSEKVPEILAILGRIEHGLPY